MLICHAAALVILCGAVITAFFKEEGSLEFSENQTRGAFVSATGTYKPLGFDIRLDEFTIGQSEKMNWKGAVKGFRSRISVIDSGKVKLRDNIEVNRPLSYGGYTFYQSGYDPGRPGWTDLKVVKDPGAGTVFFGLALLNAGALITVLKK